MENKRSFLTWEYLKITGAIVVLVPSITFVFSFFYDWGFLGVLGFSFSEAPTSITDHIRTGLVWLPTAIVIIVLFFAFEIVSIRRKADRTGEGINISSSGPFQTRLFLSGIFCLGIIAGGLFSSLTRTSNIPEVPYFVFAICWFVFAIWVIRHPVMSKRYSGLSKFLFLFWPLIPIIFLQLGQGDARYRLESAPHNHRIHLSENTRSSVMDTVIIRAFENWLLVRGKQGQVEWIKMDKIYRIEVLIEEKPYSVLLCKISKQFCLETLPE